MHYIYLFNFNNKFSIMRRAIMLVTPLLLIVQMVVAQQDAMFTKYFFNSLAVNPAYAGSKEHMTINALHRTQWWGIEGAPTTQSLSVHSPLKNDRVGLGLSLINDEIGPTKSIAANIAYAYRITFGKYKLSIGLQGGITTWRADWNQLTIHDQDDYSFNEANPSFILPNFGVGLYFSNKYWYIGLGAPRMVEYDLKVNPDEVTPFYAKQYRHYYGAIGAAIPLKGNSLIFKPSLLVKNVGLDSKFRKDPSFQNVGAPTEFNIDLSMFFYETLWLGTSFRSAVEILNGKSTYDSVDLWAAFYLRNGLRIGAAYDYTLTQLQQPAGGSFEVMLGYEFDFKVNKTVTPRYF